MSKNRSLHVLLSILLTASLAGCGSSAKPESDSKTDETAPAPEESSTPESEGISPKDQTYKIGDTITADDYEFTLVDAGFSDYISVTADDTFLQRAEEGYDAGESSKIFFFNVEYRHLNPGETIMDYPFFINAVDSGDTVQSGGCVMAYRKAGKDWHALYLTTPFDSVPSIRDIFQTEDLEYVAEEGTYQARGAIFIPQTFIDNANGHFSIRLDKYKFEFGN